MSEGRRRALEYVCQHHYTLYFALYGGAVGLLLDVVALVLLEPNTGAHIVALLNLPGLVIVILVSGFTIRKCANATYSF